MLTQNITNTIYDVVSTSHLLRPERHVRIEVLYTVKELLRYEFKTTYILSLP